MVPSFGWIHITYPAYLNLADLSGVPTCPLDIRCCWWPPELPTLRYRGNAQWNFWRKLQWSRTPSATWRRISDGFHSNHSIRWAPFFFKGHKLDRDFTVMKCAVWSVCAHTVIYRNVSFQSDILWSPFRGRSNTLTRGCRSIPIA